MSPAITGILLAAGQSRRFGSDKLLHSLPDGTPMVLAAARHLRQAVPDVIAVVAEADSSVAGQLRVEGVSVVVNGRAETGMGSSIAAGIRAAERASGWVIALADMPFLQPDTIAAVAATLASEHVIGAPMYGGRRGHPVGFGSAYREALLRLDGDAGARSLLEAYADRLCLVDTDDSGVLHDIDRPADLELVL